MKQKLEDQESVLGYQLNRMVWKFISSSPISPHLTVQPQPSKLLSARQCRFTLPNWKVLTVRRNWISSSPSPPSAIFHRGLFAAPQEKKENPSVFSLRDVDFYLLCYVPPSFSFLVAVPLFLSHSVSHTLSVSVGVCWRTAWVLCSHRVVRESDRRQGSPRLLSPLALYPHTAGKGRKGGRVS